MVVQAPWLWRRIYDGFARRPVDERSLLVSSILQTLRDRLQTDAPRVIVSTFPIYALLLSILRKETVKVPPLVTVITDSITVHPAWMAAPSDRYCVIDAESRAVVIKMGVPPESLRVTGFPVNLSFCDRPLCATDARDGVLYMPSTGEGDVARTLAGLRPLLMSGKRVTVVPGRNSRRYYHVLRRFQDACSGLPLSVLSWTDDMPGLLRTHRVIISKAGGAITNESLAALLPMVIDNVLPGQEEGNATLLVSNDCAVRAHTPDETAQCVRRLLADDAAQAKAMSSRMMALSKPCAAMAVADVVGEVAI